MIIYPAIDIKDGKCVRLTQGRFEDVTIYSDSPLDMAIKWEGFDAEYIHIVDLDGARMGEPKNLDVISSIADNIQIPFQLGGGIRTIETIETLLEKGVDRVILGTAAVRNPDLVKTALRNFRDKIAIGIDAKDGMVAIEGWERTSEFSAIEFAKMVQEYGAKTIIYTDVSRDGMLSGPNLHAMEEMVRAVDVDIIASGGVGKIQDIANLKNTGVSGVIVGKALYTGDVDLRQALEITQGKGTLLSK